MKDRSTTKKTLLLLAVLASLILLILLSLLIYIRCNSYFVNSDNGLWRVGAYRSEPFQQLWAGCLFYFGDDSISDLKIECQVENNKVYRCELPSNTETPDFYTKLLAGKPMTSIYRFYELNYGDPQFEKITITWVDSDGKPQECLFHF